MPTILSGSSKLLSTLLLVAILGACSSNRPSDEQTLVYQDDNAINPSVIGYDDYKDPLEPFNRSMFAFNDVSYRYFLTPLSKGYRFVLPEGVRHSIGNFFNNLREPLVSLNQLLQGKPGPSGKSLLRFGINSTVGILGLFDPADSWLSIEPREASFGDTLAYYGVGYGGYLVLPILGASDFRGTSSFAFGYVAHPLNLLDDDDLVLAIAVTEGFHRLAETVHQYPELVADKEDPYLFIRNLYLQNLQRDTEVLRQSKQQDPNRAPAE
jgi:phospholipid-binding lipoprotein MlaA